MFEDWKQAWREAVENFEREVRDSGDDPTAGGTHAMRSQINSARGALQRLDLEIERARQEAETEREAEQVCLRRQTLAQNIEDAETARIAADYAVKHAERAAIYERKTGVLQEERALLLRDLETMELEIAAHVDDAERISDRPAPRMDDEDEERIRQEHELSRVRRERAAEERLEELKRKMRG